MLKTKALYNLIRMSQSEGADAWAIEDLRQLDLASLWKRLAQFRIPLNRDIFAQYADEVDTPEELAELLTCEDSDQKIADQIYLVIFELWRRLYPDRVSLSIFCDELDHLIDAYDEERLESDEAIQDALDQLIDILGEHVDMGMEPKKAFTSIAEYLAHDLESFLYDYIVEQENVGYAGELIEAFEPYLLKQEWLELLRAHALCVTDVAEANQIVRKVLTHERDLDFLFEVLRFLVQAGEHDLFCLTMEKILATVEDEEDFKEAMELVADYYRRLDCDDLEEKVLRIKEQCSSPTARQQLIELICKE